MVIARLAAMAGLAALAACAPRARSEGPRPLVPEDGPETSASVYFDHDGFGRNAVATVHVRESAHVLVGHLGGDGVVRVLYPESPRASGFVWRRTTIRTGWFAADYDLDPGRWFRLPGLFRSASARFHSYDGRGHGYVFVVSSARPLDYRRVSDGGEWDEFEVRDYHLLVDPRRAILEFADAVGGSGYALEYATSFTSRGDIIQAAHRPACNRALWLGANPWHLNAAGYTIWLGHQADDPFCSSLDAYTRYAYWSTFQGGRPATPYQPVAPSPLPPVDIPVHNIPRPGRQPGEVGPAMGFTQPTFNRPVTTNRRDWDGDRRSPFGDRATPGFEPSRRTPTYVDRDYSSPMRPAEPMTRPVATPVASPSTTPAPSSPPPVRGEEQPRPKPVPQGDH